MLRQRWAIWAILFLPLLSLPAQAADFPLFWTLSGSTADRVATITIDNVTGLPTGATTEPVSPTPGTSPWGIAVHNGAGQIFWADISAGNRGVWRANFDGSGVTRIVDTGATSIFGVSVDPLINQVYYSSGSSIFRANLDGSNAAPIVSGLNGGDYIAVDPIHGFVYWTERNVDRVGRANLDGSNVVTLVDTASINGAGAVTRGIALDNDGNLFWVNNTTDTLSGVDLDNYIGVPLTVADFSVSLPTAITTAIGSAVATSTPNGLASDGEFLYWAEGLSPNRGVYRVAADGSGAGLIQGGYATTFAPIGVGSAAPIPEPRSGPLLLLAGSILTGWLVVRRPRRA